MVKKWLRDCSSMKPCVQIPRSHSLLATPGSVRHLIEQGRRATEEGTQWLLLASNLTFVYTIHKRTCTLHPVRIKNFEKFNNGTRNGPRIWVNISPKNIQMASEHMGRCSASFVTGEPQIKGTVNYSYTHTHTHPKVAETRENQQAAGEQVDNDSLVCCQGNSEMEQMPGKGLQSCHVTQKLHFQLPIQEKWKYGLIQNLTHECSQQ